MAYVVDFTARAERDLRYLYQQTNAAHSAVSRKWYRGLKKEILRLEQNPNRCPGAPENDELRHLMYGRGRNIYRVIYRIIGKKVEVLHIRHGARREFR
jgi:plasmid stabilization system protein ParE